MRKTLFYFFSLFSTLLFAQNEQALYLQKEHDRLARSANHEAAIQGYINQNISSFILPTEVLNKLTTQKDEDGNLPTASQLDVRILENKKQLLRQQFFNNNPSIGADYFASPITSATTCANNGFENGDTSGFSFFSQRFNTWEIFGNFPSIPAFPQVGSIITLVESGNDPITSLPKVKNGTYAIRLNNSVDGNYDVSMMQKQVIVGADQDKITFNYALVLQDPGHTSTTSNGVVIRENPYFQCRLRKGNDIIFRREIVADKGNTDIFMVKKYNNQDLVYTDWVCENIDVSQYKGQELTLEVIVADCGQSGHWGYAYFDDFCGTKCSAPTFGSVKLDPMGMSCPLLPLTVSGSYIAPAGYILENLTLRAIDADTNQVVYTSAPGQYILFGNEFNFKITAPNLFSATGPGNKKFDFFVSAKFKLVNSDSYMQVESSSANSGPDVVFGQGCNICNSCAPPTNTYWFMGRWPAGTHGDGGYVDYMDTDGTTQRAVIGHVEDGCKSITAVHIINTVGVETCAQ